MKSYKFSQKPSGIKQESKKENAQDTISKSVKIIYKPLKLLIMKTLKNKVQLIGNVGEDSKSHYFERGKNVTRFTLATNEYFRRDGEKVQQTDWHYLVAWDKQVNS